MPRIAEDTEVREVAPGHFHGVVSGNWSVNGNPNGGYLMALMAQAALRRSGKSATPILTANFVSRATPGPAEIFVDEITHSGQFHRFEVRLVQHGREKVRGLATFATRKAGCTDVRYETGPPPLPPRDVCVPMPEITEFTLFREVELLLDPACAGWLQDRLSERSENRGWMRLRGRKSYDLPSLLVIADSLPPAILASRGKVPWVPTIELSVNVRNLPKSEWLNCSLRTRFVTSGLLEADGEIWDEEGNLIAISRQIAQVRTP